MSAYLRLEAYDQAKTGITVLTPGQVLGVNPTVVFESDWGNAVWEQALSGARGTLGRRAAGQQPKDREVAIKFRIYGTSKDNFALRASQLYEVCDLIRRFGGRITRRAEGQTFRQHLEVLATPGLALIAWDQRVEYRDRGEFLFQATCAPYANGDPWDIVDEYDTNTVVDYTFDAGAAGNVAIGAGVIDAVTSLTTENRLIHTALGYTYSDHQVTVQAQPGATITSYKTGCIVKRIDVANYLEAYVDENGTNSRLRLDKVVATIRTNLASTNLAARITGGTPFVVRGRIERNTVYAEYFLGTLAKHAQAPTTSLTAYVLTTTEAAIFGIGIRGRAGVTFLPQHTDAKVNSFAVGPYTYRAAVLPDTFRLDGIPGDVDALMSTSIAVADQAAIDFALVGWTASPPPVNLLDMGDDFGVITTQAWSIAAVTNINNAATSVTRVTSAPKYGANHLQVICVLGNADSGIQRRIYRRFRKGVPYTFRAWLNASPACTLRIGNGAANDVATSGPSSPGGWVLMSVVWTPTADREDAHIAVRRTTAGVADVVWIDAEEVYEGTVAPTLSSQIEGRGGPAPFGILEAENTVQTGSTVAADASASAGFVAAKSAQLVVDPNALTPDDGSDSVLVEVWGRLRLLSSFSKLTAKAKMTPLRAGADEAWTLEYGSGGRTVSLPSGGTVSRFIRFGTLSIPVTRDRGRVVIQARVDHVVGAPVTSGYKFPTTDGAGGGGGSGWTSPTNAYSDNNADTFPAALYATWMWGTFTFGLPGGATPVGIEVTMEAYNSGNTDQGPCSVSVYLSPNAGTSFTFPAKSTGNLPINIRTTYVLGGPTDLWGRTWTDTELNNTNFRVMLLDLSQPGGVPQVDYVKVNVYYTTSADLPQMDQIILVPAKRRAVTATGKDPITGVTWLPASTGVDLEKLIAPDLSGVLGTGESTQDTGGLFGSPGLGGSLLEIPSPSSDVVVKLSALIPDAPTRSSLSEAVNYTATVHFAVTPRWAILRDA